MTKKDTRQALLEAGAKTFLERGFNNTAIDTVLKTVGVPKGSFYYYFDSKEDFGIQVIDYHMGQTTPEFEHHLLQPHVPPIQRLRNYFDAKINEFEGRGCQYGCLVGNLIQEMSDQNDLFRQKLGAILEHWRGFISQCFREAQQLGQFPTSADPDRMAEFVIFSWEGALLKGKVSRSCDPLHTFSTVLFDVLLQSTTFQ